ncbi:MAG: zwf [Bacilli bacterium]|nr:zwf [Bacilli bacterium]
MSTNEVTFLIFGATGDLAHRKLFPAIYCLFCDGRLDEDFGVIGIARRDKQTEDFHKDVRESIEHYSRYKIEDEDAWQRFISRFYYYGLDVSNQAGYSGLKDMTGQLEQQLGLAGNRLFYLAMAPNYFGVVAQNVRSSGLKESSGWTRLIIEKPFGHDLPSANELNEQIHNAFAEDETYRIDHYLGKEMVQNIEVIRFANAMFEPLWNNRHIDNIQITLSEVVGVEERAGYYESAGALRDMVQNHIMQMIMMVAMEPPSRFETEAIRDEKVKVLRSMRRYSPDEIKQYVVRGQYGPGELQGKSMPGYREEPGVNPESTTETFVAAKLFVDNFRWAGVPFYVRTGKRLPTKTTEIVLELKGLPQSSYLNMEGKMGPNLIVIRIQPVEGMYLNLNAKKHGAGGGVEPITFEYCNNCDQESTMEAYERLFIDCIKGDPTFFTRWDEVMEAWEIADPIEQLWQQEKPAFPNYAAGTWGPQAADELLSKGGHHWWPVYGQKMLEGVQASQPESREQQVATSV